MPQVNSITNETIIVHSIKHLYLQYPIQNWDRIMNQTVIITTFTTSNTVSTIHMSSY